MYKLVLLLVMSTVTLNCNANSADYKLIEKNLKNYEKRIHSLQQSIDNSIFDDEEILLKLDFDTDNLIAFMQSEFAFHPYDGLLRGVQGTLNSRSGNALDQAVLLAKLLNDAGLETRIANGTLSIKQTKLLLTGISNANIPQHIGNGKEFEKAIASLNSLASSKQNKPINWQESITNNRYKSTANILQKALKNNDILLKSKDITTELINANKDYFWVEYRLSVTDAWKSAHPAFTKNSQIEVNAESYFKGSVPKKYMHQVRIEAFIQQRFKDKYTTHSLMKPWEIPLANLQNVLITYSNAPSGVSTKSDYDLSTIIDKTSFFTPTLNGHAVGGKVFDLKGRLIDSEAMNSQAGAFFKTVGDKTLMAVDAISGEKAGETSMQLTAQWIQFTFTSPNGDEFTQKRYIYQSTKKGKINEKDVKIQLLTEYALLANSGDKPMAYIAKVYLDLVENGLPLLKSSTRKLFSKEKKSAFPKKIARNEFELLTQYYWMAQNPNISKNIIHYRNSANMLGFKRGYVDPKTAFVAVDIIRNNQQFIQKKQDKYFTDPQAAFSQGIWDTAIENLPAQILGIKGNTINTLRIMNLAEKQNVKLEVIKSNDEKLNKIFKNDKITLNRLQSDLDLGYWVVVPSQTPKGLSLSGWWRINPITGETLGMTADGGGQSTTEYMIQNAQTALSLIRAVGNLKKCEKLSNDLEKLCCLAEAHFNNVAGIPFGAALGGALGTAGAALFDIVDFTAEVATGTGIAPSTNGKLCAGIDFPDF